MKHVFATQCDWWVAETTAEVEALVLAHYGDTIEERCDEIEQLPDDSTVKITCDEAGAISEEGDGFSVTRTCREWADREPVGLLASTEC